MNESNTSSNSLRNAKRRALRRQQKRVADAAHVGPARGESLTLRQKYSAFATIAGWIAVQADLDRPTQQTLTNCVTMYRDQNKSLNMTGLDFDAVLNALIRLYGAK